MREDYETSDLWQTAFMICKGARLRKMTMEKMRMKEEGDETRKPRRTN